MKRRIRRYDERQWVTEFWQEGELQTKGFLKGKVSKGKWKVTGYFTQIQHIPSPLFNEMLGDVWNDLSPVAAMEDATSRFLLAFSAFLGEKVPKDLGGRNAAVEALTGSHGQAALKGSGEGGR